MAAAALLRNDDNSGAADDDDDNDATAAISTTTAATAIATVHFVYGLWFHGSGINYELNEIQWRKKGNEQNESL